MYGLDAARAHRAAGSARRSRRRPRGRGDERIRPDRRPPRDRQRSPQAPARRTRGGRAVWARNRETPFVTVNALGRLGPPFVLLSLYIPPRSLIPFRSKAGFSPARVERAGPRPDPLLDFTTENSPVGVTRTPTARPLAPSPRFFAPRKPASAGTAAGWTRTGSRPERTCRCAARTDLQGARSGGDRVAGGGQRAEARPGVTWAEGPHCEACGSRASEGCSLTRPRGGRHCAAGLACPRHR